MRVLLIEPAQADPSQPYSSLAVLAGAWRSAGLEVELADLNVDFFNHLCLPSILRDALETVELRLRAGRFRDEEEQQVLEGAVVSGEWILPALERAMQIIRDPAAFYDPRAYAWAFRMLSRVLGLVSASAYPGRVSLQTFQTAQSHLSSTGIRAAVDDEDSNLFIRYCEEKVHSRLLAARPDVIAVSVTFQTQLIPAWTLAVRAKKWLPEAKIVFGGATITRIRNKLARCPQLLTDVDAFVFFEGETALPALAEEWEHGRDGLKAPNVMVTADGQGICSAHSCVEDLNALPPPDHTGLPLQDYWWPEPALLLNGSRGCYWGRCAFCTISPGSWGPERRGKAFRWRTAEKVMNDLAVIHHRTGARAFNLSNDSLPPRVLAEIGDAVRQSGLDITWDSEVRLDRGLSRKTLARMVAGGCRHLRFGFETASARVAGLMQKGTSPEVTHRILRDCREEGITVSLLCQVGFPGETSAESEETLRYLQEKKDLVAFVSLTEFTLEEGSKVFDNPASFGVSVLASPEDEDLSWLHWFTGMTGNSQEGSRRLSRIEAALDETYPDRDLFFKGGLGHAHTTLYTRRYPPAFFSALNREPLRRPRSVSLPAVLRTAECLSLWRRGESRLPEWSSFAVSSAEVPELRAQLAGNALLVLAAASIPRRSRALVGLICRMSQGSYTEEEAEAVLDSFFRAGLLLDAARDERACSLPAHFEERR